MHDLVQDLRFAVRMLARNPAFTAVAVLALALGMGANTAVFTVVNGVLLRPLPFPEPERLFLISYISEPGPFNAGPALSDGHFLEFRRHLRLFEPIASFARYPVSLTGAGEPIRLSAATVTPDFLTVLRVNAAMGRTFLADEDQPGRNHVALLSDKLWRRRFGADPQVLGKTITLDGNAHTVIGIMPAGFTFPYDAELWTPLAVRIDAHNSFLRPVVGRLRPGVSAKQAQAEVEAVARELPPGREQRRGDLTTRVIPLKELLVRDIRKSLLIFAGAVAFVLLIACANVANLLLMRAASRRQEVAVRAALGAGRRRLVRQLLTESLLVAMLGGAAGILLAIWCVPGLLAMAPAGKIPRLEEIHVDRWVLAFTFGLSAITGLLFGLAPAFHATGRELRGALSRSARASGGRHEVLRGALVVSEFALALVLLAGAGLMLRSFLRTRAVNPGFRAENVLTMTVDLPDAIYRNAGEMQSFHERTLARLSQLPGVLAACAVNWMPLGPGLTRGDFNLKEGRQLPPGFMADKLVVSPGYFLAMGIRLLGGRDFTEHDNAGAPGVVAISQSVARRLWPEEDPIGKQITMEDPRKPDGWLTIVAVADDIHQEGLTKRPHPALYQPYLQVRRQSWLGHMTFAVRAVSNPLSLAPAMRAVLREVDKDQPVESIATMEAVIASTTSEPLFQTRLLVAFSVVALALAAIGIYGVLAYSVTERTHEIGIRMALGAESGDVMRMVLRRTLVLAATGVTLGIAGALAVTRVLEKFLFEVKPHDGATLVVVASVMAAVALLASWIPARRATRVDPLVALRYD
jgi:putative ABC transport system permease protein